MEGIAKKIKSGSSDFVIKKIKASGRLLPSAIPQPYLGEWFLSFCTEFAVKKKCSGVLLGNLGVLFITLLNHFRRVWRRAGAITLLKLQSL